MMPWSKEPVTRLFTVADRCRNTSRRPGFTETEHCCRPLSREHLYNTAADRCPAKINWVINWHHWSGRLFALARQSSHAAERSLARALCRLPGKAAMQQAATHQRSLAHWESARINADVHVWSSPRHARLHGAMHSCTRFRGVPTTLHGQNSWPSFPCDMSGQAGLAHTLTVPLGPNDARAKKNDPHSEAHSLFSKWNSARWIDEVWKDFIILIKRKSPLLFEYKLFKIQYKIQYWKEKVGYMLVLILVLLYVYSSIYINNGKFITNIYIYIYIYMYI